MENPFSVLERRLNTIENFLLDIRQQLQEKPASSAKEIGGIKLAEEITGLSKPRIYTLVSERKIPHSKRGNRLFFTRSQLIQWALEGNRREKGGDRL